MSLLPNWLAKLILQEKFLSFAARSDLVGVAGAKFREKLVQRVGQAPYVIPIRIAQGRTVVRTTGRGSTLPHAWRFTGAIRGGTIEGWLRVPVVPRTLMIFFIYSVLAILGYGTWIAIVGSSASNGTLARTAYVLALAYVVGVGLLLAIAALSALSGLPFRRRAEESVLEILSDNE